jgi:CRP/FNR family cyclic AMP-dependent transcriptional regulator
MEEKEEPNLPPYLGEFTDEDARWFAHTGELWRVHAGEVVITEGVTPEHIHVVLKGEFVVSSAALRDPEMQRVGPGELLGEMSYINGVPPGSSVGAATDGVLLSVRRKDIDAKIDSDPAFGSRFRKVISEFAVTRIFRYGRRKLIQRTLAGDLPESKPKSPSVPASDEGDEQQDEKAAQEEKNRRVRELIEIMLDEDF